MGSRDSTPRSDLPLITITGAGGGTWGRRESQSVGRRAVSQGAQEHEETEGKKGEYLGKSPWGGEGSEVIVSEGKGCLQERGWLSPLLPDDS